MPSIISGKYDVTKFSPSALSATGFIYMTRTESICKPETPWDRVTGPVLSVRTEAGRGVYSVGEAIRERLAAEIACEHLCIEEFLPADRVAADLLRYRRICRYSPALLALVYSIPWFYKRKYLAECRAPSDLDRKSTRLNSSHSQISYAVFCLKKKTI